mgnify:FL=1
MSTGETLEQRIIVTSSFKYQDYGSGGGGNPVYYAFLYYRVR